MSQPAVQGGNGRPSPRGTAGRPPIAARAALCTVAVLAAAGAAGCGVSAAQQDATSGLARQVVAGEHVGAETRAQAAREPKAAERVSAGVRRKVPGSQVVAIGDSVMAASAFALASTMPGIYIDAVPDRQMPAGLAIVRRLAAAGKLRPVLVMGLGTNYIVTTGQLSELMRLIGPHRRLVLVNTYVPDGWSPQVNATDAAFAGRHPSVVLADWYDTIKNRMSLLWPDHIHPMMPGTWVYARMVYRAVQATLQAPGSLPTGGVTASELSPVRVP